MSVRAGTLNENIVSANESVHLNSEIEKIEGRSEFAYEFLIGYLAGFAITFFALNVFAAEPMPAAVNTNSSNVSEVEKPKEFKKTGISIFGDLAFGKIDHASGSASQEDGVDFKTNAGYSLNAGYRFIEELELGAGLGVLAGEMENQGSILDNTAMAYIEAIAKVFPARKWNVPAYVILSYSPYEKFHYTDKSFFDAFKGDYDSPNGISISGKAYSIGLGYEHQITENVYIFGQYRHRSSTYDKLEMKDKSVSLLGDLKRDSDTFSIGLGALL